MKAILTTWKRPLLVFFFYVFIAAALIAPISSDSFVPALADYINHLSGIIQAKMALTEGQFPLRIAPVEQSGWRYPYYQFYSPTVYLFSALIYKWLVPSNPLIAFKITLWAALVIAGIYMERLAFWWSRSRPAAILASLVYLFSPYYIVVINNFGDLSEILALAIVPVILFYSIRYYFRPKDPKIFLQMGISWYCLMTIHIVTFVYTAFFLGIFLLLLSIKNRRHWQNGMSVAIAIGFGCLLAMWYLAPIALLGNDVLVSQTFAKSSRFMSFKPTLGQLLFSGAFEFKKELISNHPGIGWTILLSVAICFYALLHQSGIRSKRANYLLPTLLSLFFLAFILIWSPFDFWGGMPSLFMIGQYSWRLLGQVIWIGALLFAFAVCWLFKDGLNQRHIIIGALVIATVSSAYFPTINDSSIDLEKFIKKPYFIYNHNSYSINFNKNTQYVDAIDTLVMYALMANNTLQLKLPYIVPRSLIHFAKAPVVSLQGTVPATVPHDEKLMLFMNHVQIAEHHLVPGKFNWDVPLLPFLGRFSEETTLDLQFQASPKEDIKLPIQKAVFGGFFRPLEIMSVKTVQPFCHQEKTKTLCKIQVPPGIELIELPILYYPKLLHITLNGKPVDYQSIVYFDSLLTTIKPETNKMNVINISFQGLPWANRVSEFAWGAWFLLLIVLLYKRGLLIIQKII